MKIDINGEKYNFITDDSRLINKDGAFLITYHNKKFKKEVEEKGCAFFLTPQDLFKKWNLSKIKIIGITGTNGKTTTTNIIAHILKKNNFKVAVSGTEGIFLHDKNNIKQIAPRTHTTPEILTTLNNLKIALDNDADFFVMEVSSHGIYQKRIGGIEFSSKVFTNLSQDHLDFHKTMEEYAKVKSSFFQDETPKVINLDDNWIKYNKKNFLSYSLKKSNANLFADNCNFKNGIEADILWNNKKYHLKSKIIGEFNLYNILAAMGSILETTNLDIKDIIKSSESFKGVDGRMEILYQKGDEKKFLKIFSDYAHTPDAIEKVLNSIKSNNVKIITIIGAGGDRDASKRPEMALQACQNSDFVILTSDNPRNEKPDDILKDMEVGVKGKFNNYQIILDRKEAIKESLKEGMELFDNTNPVFVAILGKGNENYMEINNQKIPYSDKKEVREYFLKN